MTQEGRSITHILKDTLPGKTIAKLETDTFTVVFCCSDGTKILFRVNGPEEVELIAELEMTVRYRVSI